MPSFRLQHRQTGQLLPGYRVLAADEAEIAAANQNMQRIKSEYRYVMEHPLRDGTPAFTSGSEETLQQS
jgi:hypothetical protein